MSLPDFYLPAAAVLPGVDDEHSSLLRLCQRRRQKSYRQPVQQLWVAIFGGACEREFGRTFTLQFYPEYLIFFPAMLFGRSLMPPMARCPLSTHLTTSAPPLLGTLSPVSPPPPGQPWGASAAVNTRSGRLPVPTSTSESLQRRVPAAARPADGPGAPPCGGFGDSDFISSGAGPSLRPGAGCVLVAPLLHVLCAASGPDPGPARFRSVRAEPAQSLWPSSSSCLDPQWSPWASRGPSRPLCTLGGSVGPVTA